MRVFFLLTISILFIEQLKCDELVEMSDGSGEEPDSKIVEMLSGDDASNKTKFIDTSEVVHLSPINLEKFIDVDFENVELLENLTELAVEFNLYNHTELPPSELTNLYGHAFENLIKMAPNLQILHPIGGHFYFPDNGTVQQIESELQFVKNGLDLLTLLMKKHNLTLTDDRFDYIKYNLYLIVEEEALNDTEYYQLINKTFGSEPMRLINQKLPAHSVALIFELNDVNIKLDLVKFTEVDDENQIPGKRRDYKEVVNQLFDFQSKKNEQIVDLLL